MTDDATSLMEIARGCRDDFLSLAHPPSKIAAHHRTEAAFSVDPEYTEHREKARALQDRSDAFMSAANLIAHAFSIPENGEDDPPGSRVLRLLRDDGEPASPQPYYVASEDVQR